MTRPIDWSYIRKHAWRFQGGDKWTPDMGSLKVFIAQSNATGFPRLLGIALTLLADVVFYQVSSPLLTRGMKGGNLGVGAPPWSLTALAWKASGITNDSRWAIKKQANRFARYNA